MNTKHYHLYPLFVMLFSIFTLSAQEDLSAEEALNKAAIEDQFDILIQKSGRYQDYKVVKQIYLNKLKSNVTDSINNLETSLKERNSQIAQQKNTLDQLQKNLAETNEKLAVITNEKDSISFFGALLNKSTYRTIMWLIIVALLLLLGFFIFKFKNSNTITIQAKNSLADLEAEFEEHRRRALEREQKVMRKLQDEINKQKKGSK
ncbi:tRNA (guanine-N1)-methyltransferase [Aquimarina brevivitae]|uniref:tRNA (Guanine-N1)-methyltransferase n=1 Tax=Aquimarina brevivitae TaxID=323412 RepID=A0A4Q7NZ59_9FLAO|nr:tRNA (guanine-N1)-methyltransferase [Aquimarina brevivitae]RZS92635.1 hypothetical protein EV197_2773 [Aquimarina brevivitae]